MLRNFSIVTVLTTFFISTQYLSAASVDSGAQFEYRTFATCQEFESTLKQILPTTYNYGRTYELDGMMMAESSIANIPPTASLTDNGPKSDTNVQVKGIDEADTAKTDGKYVYSYQDTEHAIIILDANTLVKVKTLRIPSNYSGVSFYVTKNKLVLTATKYLQSQNYWTYWYNNTQKSIIELYDIRDISRASLVRSIEIDGNLSDTRLSDTGIMTAVVATSYGLPPIYRYAVDGVSSSKMIVKPQYDYSSKNLIPRISDQQFSNGKRTTTNRGISDCTGMSSILPKMKTLSNYSINPTLTSILRFDISIPSSKINSQVVVSEVGQIHVTRDSVYLTANMWQQNRNSKCPINTRCVSPIIWNPGTSNTLVHRFAVSNTNIRYNYSRLVSGYPLNQYSMDEDASGNFRIVTSISSWSGGINNSSTKLSVLSPIGSIIGSISSIAPGENFQSSRFIGTRLYLVTFQQIDPLFVIDLADPKNPKILGELKIPGYSTYLHPYDGNRLIGLGYDTKVNQWGGTQNAGIKVDLYNVSDVAHPKQEASLILGDMSSSSDALWNPKAFVWYKEKNLLLIPATLMTSAGNKENTYLSKAAFQGMLGISILPNSIQEKFRVTHIVPSITINETWKKDCDQYKKNTTGYQQYIPEYCKAGSTVEMYMANTLWNYSSDFVSRVLYVGEKFYTIGSSRIQSQKFSSPNTPTAIQVFKKQSQSRYPMLMDAISTIVR